MQRDFQREYKTKTDEQLLALALDESGLIGEAQAELDDELASRGLTTDHIEAFRQEQQERNPGTARREVFRVWTAAALRVITAPAKPSASLQKWRLSDCIALGVVLLGSSYLGFWLIPSVMPHFQHPELWPLVPLVMQFGAATAMTVAICKRRKLGNLFSNIGWNLNRYVGTCLLAGLGLAVLLMFVQGLILVLRFGAIPKLGGGPTAATILLFFLSGVLLQPFLEECYFRGVLFLAVSEKLGPFGVVVLTSVFFALCHIGRYRLILVFLLAGVVLAIARIKTNSVAACFALHAAYNAGTMLVTLWFF